MLLSLLSSLLMLLSFLSSLLLLSMLMLLCNLLLFDAASFVSVGMHNLTSDWKKRLYQLVLIGFVASERLSARRTFPKCQVSSISGSRGALMRKTNNQCGQIGLFLNGLGDKIDKIA